MIIIRIVRMTFLPEKAGEFQRMFEQCKNDIQSMPGCLYLELWRDLDQPNIFVTYSHWESEQAFDDYRRTEFFGVLWKKTKAFFAEAPVLFSAEKVG
jgi:quinol monooxygenase YgiN